MAFSVRKFMFPFFLIIVGLVYQAETLEELAIVYAPESIKFYSSEPVRSNYLNVIFSTMLSYTMKTTIPWNSLATVTPWKRPEGLVVIELLGFDAKIDLPLDGNKFRLENYGDLTNEYNLIAYRTNERYFGKSPVMLQMDLSNKLHDSKISQPVILKHVPADPKKRLQMALKDPELGELVKKSIFNITLPSDVKLLTELATMKEFLKALSVHKSEIHDNVPDIYWLKLSGLEPIVSYYGHESIQFKEALRLLRQIISEVEGSMRDIYDNNVVVAVIKTNSITLPLGYKGRRLLETVAEGSTAAPKPDPNPHNLVTTEWDPMFPVTFSIILFISLLLALSVFGITVAMWNMDPGRDSIIYRMTSQRMKKD